MADKNIPSLLGVGAVLTAVHNVAMQNLNPVETAEDERIRIRDKLRERARKTRERKARKAKAEAESGAGAGGGVFRLYRITEDLTEETKYIDPNADFKRAISDKIQTNKKKKDYHRWRYQQKIDGEWTTLSRNSFFKAVKTVAPVVEKKKKEIKTREIKVQERIDTTVAERRYVGLADLEEFKGESETKLVPVSGGNLEFKTLKNKKKRLTGVEITMVWESGRRKPIMRQILRTDRDVERRGNAKPRQIGTGSVIDTMFARTTMNVVSNVDGRALWGIFDDFKERDWNPNELASITAGIQGYWKDELDYCVLLNRDKASRISGIRARIKDMWKLARTVNPATLKREIKTRISLMIQDLNIPEDIADTIATVGMERMGDHGVDRLNDAIQQAKSIGESVESLSSVMEGDWGQLTRQARQLVIKRLMHASSGNLIEAFRINPKLEELVFTLSVIAKANPAIVRQLQNMLGKRFAPLMRYFEENRERLIANNVLGDPTRVEEVKDFIAEFKGDEDDDPDDDPDDDEDDGGGGGGGGGDPDPDPDPDEPPDEKKAYNKFILSILTAVGVYYKKEYLKSKYEEAMAWAYDDKDEAVKYLEEFNLTKEEINMGKEDEAEVVFNDETLIQNKIKNISVNIIPENMTDTPTPEPPTPEEPPTTPWNPENPEEPPTTPWNPDDVPPNFIPVPQDGNVPEPSADGEIPNPDGVDGNGNPHPESGIKGTWTWFNNHWMWNYMGTWFSKEPEKKEAGTDSKETEVKSHADPTQPLEHPEWRPESIFVGTDITLESAAQSAVDLLLFNSWDNLRSLNPLNDSDNPLWKLNLQDLNLKYNNNFSLVDESSKLVKRELDKTLKTVIPAVLNKIDEVIFTHSLPFQNPFRTEDFQRTLPEIPSYIDKYASHFTPIIKPDEFETSFLEQPLFQER